MDTVITQPTGRGTEIIVKEYRYRDIVLPVGFESDGATIPRIFWVIYPPFYPDYKTAVFVHDYLCGMEDYKKADRYFYELLLATGVDKNTRRNIFMAVKLWHRMAYRSNNKHRKWLDLYKKISKKLS